MNDKRAGMKRAEQDRMWWKRAGETPSALVPQPHASVVDTGAWMKGYFDYWCRYKKRPLNIVFQQSEREFGLISLETCKCLSSLASAGLLRSAKKSVLAMRGWSEEKKLPKQKGKTIRFKRHGEVQK